MAVLIQISGFVAWMIMMLAWDFLLSGFVAMPMLIDIPRLVTGVLVMGAGLFLLHLQLLWLSLSTNDPAPGTFPSSIRRPSCFKLGDGSEISDALRAFSQCGHA